jgi:hypothetical protein
VGPMGSFMPKRAPNSLSAMFIKVLTIWSVMSLLVFSEYISYKDAAVSEYRERSEF